MSISLYIESHHDLALEKLVKRVERICGTPVTDCDSSWPNVMLGLDSASLTGIEIARLDTVYEIRIPTMAHSDDYRLLRATATEMSRMLGVDVFDSQGRKVDLDLEMDDEWVKRRMTTDLKGVAQEVRRTGTNFRIRALSFSFMIGAGLIFRDGDPDRIIDAPDYELLDALRDTLWSVWDAYDAPVSLVEPEPGADSEECKTATVLTPDMDRHLFPMVLAKSDLLTVADDSRGVEVMVPFEYVPAIFHDIAVGIDAEQMVLMNPLSKKRFGLITRRARYYEPPDIWYPPVYPGTGYDEEQRTFLLRWDPEISSISMEKYLQLLRRMLTDRLNWSVHDYTHARMHDRFFMLRVSSHGTDDTHLGIVQSGIFSSNPYGADSWRADGTKVHYCDLKSNVMLHPQKAPILTVSELEEALPSIDWRTGHSGIMLDPQSALTLEELWSRHIALWRDTCDFLTIAYTDPY